MSGTSRASRLTQRDLVIRARSGDHGAFSLLATSLVGRLFGIARLILRDDGRAEDAVQDALVLAWLDIRGLRDPDRFDAWLNRLLVRSCYRSARAERTRRRVEVPLLELDRKPEADLESSIAMRDQLERGFRRLSTEHRAVLVMHHYLDLSDGEAALVLDVPLGMFKSRLSRAAHALRAAVDADSRRPASTGEFIA